jgi:hypothetical protein
MTQIQSAQPHAEMNCSGMTIGCAPSETKAIEHGKTISSENQLSYFRGHESERLQILEAGVTFDGRRYKYLEYQYDILSDALNYSLLDRAKSSHKMPIDVQMVWKEPHTPSMADKLDMDRLSITFDGRYYRFKDYRYDNLTDACSYAKLKSLVRLRTDRDSEDM